jgi:hypothetical protein
MSLDAMSLDAVHHDGGYYTYVSSFGMWGLVGSHVVSGNEWLQCAAAARYLGGGWVNSVWHNMPSVTTWYQGAPLSKATAPGTVVVINWAADGSYPNHSIEWYQDQGIPLSQINHTLVFAYIDERGMYHLFSQYKNHEIYETIVPADQASQYSEVRVSDSNGPYESTPSDRSVAEGNGASGSTGINTRVPSVIGGVFYPFGFGNRSPSLNFGEGRAGTMLGPFTWSMNDAFLTGVLNWGDVGRDMYANLVGSGESGLGCFVAGTPVSMADGTEKPIEAIQAGEQVLAWDDDTRQIFETRVIKPLHHEAKMQTLFDIELEDGRRLTVNNNHPIYVIEDDEFILTRELAACFANGQPITFQDNKGQAIRVANIHMRRQMCKVYNLEVKGQGQNGHTYYAGGVLVHNRGRNKWK